MTDAAQPGPVVRRDITKEEAARRQLDRAIKMFFDLDDDLCTHVLVSAAGQILADCCKASEIKTTEDIMLEHIQPEMRKELSLAMRRSYNYFKHADRDHNVPLSHFDREVNSFLLYRSCEDYVRLFRQHTSAIMVFRTWFVARHPEAVVYPNPEHDRIRRSLFGPIDHLTHNEARRKARAFIRALHAFEEIIVANPRFTEALGPIIPSSDYFPE